VEDPSTFEWDAIVGKCECSVFWVPFVQLLVVRVENNHAEIA